MDTALKSLDAFLRKEIFENYRYINYGGCCMYAAHLAKYLCKIGTVKIRVTDWQTEDGAIEEARKHVDANTPYEWNDHGVYFNHIFVELTYKGEVYHVDAEGITKASDKRYDNIIKGELLLKEAKELGDCAAGWNTRFDRRNIPAIKLRTNTYFKNHLVAGVKGITRELLG